VFVPACPISKDLHAVLPVLTEGAAHRQSARIHRRITNVPASDTLRNRQVLLEAITLPGKTDQESQSWLGGEITSTSRGVPAVLLNKAQVRGVSRHPAASLCNSPPR
jgi:hypothetical protein